MKPSSEETAVREWYDTGLIAYIVVFFLIELAMLVRTTRLAWALSLKCTAFALIWAYALVAPYYPTFAQNDWVLTTLRFLLASALTWTVFELAYNRWGHPRLWRGVAKRYLVACCSTRKGQVMYIGGGIGLLILILLILWLTGAIH